MLISFDVLLEDEVDAKLGKRLDVELVLAWLAPELNGLLLLLPFENDGNTELVEGAAACPKLKGEASELRGSFLSEFVLVEVKLGKIELLLPLDLTVLSKLGKFTPEVALIGEDFDCELTLEDVGRDVFPNPKGCLDGELGLVDGWVLNPAKVIVVAVDEFVPVD